MEDVSVSKNYCPMRCCNGQLLKSKKNTTGYNWAIPMICNTCKITRFACKLCPTNNRTGYNTILVRSRMWKHNVRHLTRDELDSKIALSDSTRSKNGRQMKYKVKSNQKHDSKETVLYDRKIALSDSTSSKNGRNTKYKVTSNQKHDNEETELYPNLGDISVKDIKTSFINNYPDVHNGYDNQHSYDYYKHNATMNVEDSGPAYMVGKAIMGTMNAHRYMNKDDILLHLLLAKFTATLSCEQKKHFGLILQLITKKDKNGDQKFTYNNKKRTSEMVYDDVTNDVPVDEFERRKHIASRYPLDESSIRRYYHKGPNSILHNLPQPNITVISNHSYVSIRQCIADYLGKGGQTNMISDKPKACQKFLTDSKIANEVYHRAMACNRDTSEDNLLVLLGIQWSDDFEPNTSSKTNRGSVWLKTLTFISDGTQMNDLKIRMIYQSG